MTDLYFKMVLSLFFVLTIIGVAYLIVKKRLNLSNSGGIFQVIDYKSFGPKSGIMALRFGEKILLLAITPTNISMLEQFDARSIFKNTENKDEILEKIKRLKDSINEPN